MFYLKTLSTPLIILDEAGDLDYTVFLEIKALWNATELAYGYYMMGTYNIPSLHRIYKELSKTAA